MRLTNPTESDIDAGWVKIKAGETVVVSEQTAKKAIENWGFLSMMPDEEPIAPTPAPVVEVPKDKPAKKAKAVKAEAPKKKVTKKGKK